MLIIARLQFVLVHPLSMKYEAQIPKILFRTLETQSKVASVF